MTDKRGPSALPPGAGDEADDRVLELLAAALTEDGELLPTTEAEVAAVENEFEELELPASLQTLASDARPLGVTASGDQRATRQSPRLRASVWTHVAAMALSAAAALALSASFRERGAPRLPLSGDPAGVSVPSVPKADEGVLLEVSCEACCGGGACVSARAGLENCPSGRNCIACDPGVLADSRYRIRVGAVTPAALGMAVLERYPNGEPELCVRAGVSKELCVATLISERGGGRWATIPAVFSGEDLAAKLLVRLRWKGVQGPLATAGRWTMPVALTPKSLCSGYNVKLYNDDKGESFGSLSLFLDDAHYVEISRGLTTGALRELRKRLVLRGLTAQLFEIRGRAAAKFVLTAGPFNRKTAEALRWQLLEQKLPATTTLGLEHVGEPLPLP